MKNLLVMIGCIGLVFGSVARAAAATAQAPMPAAVASSGGGEDWKGKSDGSEVHFGGLTGLGIIDFHPGFVLLGTASKKIVHSGFVPDITNSVSIEAEAGPLFAASTTLFDYSLHLRWDFEKDEHWIFYAIGGVGGFIAGSSFGSDNFMVFPRFGLGTFFRVNDLILIRGEISHELIAAGITIPLYL
jgi:hypothetical protein